MAGRRSILVTNLPDIKEGSLLDKLEIHFGRRSNGGDDVDSVKIGKQNGVPGIYAVITFAEEETVSSVLKKQHIFFGEKLQIQPYFPTNGASEGDNYGNLTSTSSDQNVQLVVSRQFQGDLLESVAASTKTQLGVDEKTARFTFTGHPHDVMTVATKLSSYSNGTKIHPIAVSDSNGKEEIEDKEIAKAFEKFHLGNDLEEDRTSHNHGIVNSEQPTDEVRQCKTILHSVKRKILPKPSQKLLKSSSPYKTVKHSRNSANFDQKVLDYIGLVHLRAVEIIRKEFMVNFDNKRGGVVEVSCQGAKTDQQNIKDAIEALEALVNQTKQMGLITEIVDVRQFPDASKEVWETATKDARRSTQVLVTQRTLGRLEFFGTEREVRQEIAKLRNTVLGRRPPDELDRDGLSNDDIDQEVSEERDLRQDPVEGMRGQAEKEAQIKKEVALVKEQTDGLGMLAHPFGDAVEGATSSAGIYSSPVDTKPSVGFSPASQVTCGSNKGTYILPSVEPDGQELFKARKISYATIASEIPMATCMNAPPCEDLIKADSTEREETYTGGSAAKHNQAAENEQCFQALVRPPYRDLVDSDYQDYPQPLEGESESSNDETAECDQPYQRKSASSMDSAGHKRPPTLTDCQKREPNVPRIFTSVNSNQMEMEKQSSSSDKPVPMQASVVPFMYIRADTTNPFRLKGAASAGCSKGLREESQRDSRGTTSYPYMLPHQTQESFTGMPTSAPQLPYNRLDIAESLPTFFAPFRPESPTLGPNFGGDFTISLKTGMKVIIRQGDLTDEFTNVIVSWADPHLRLQVGVGRAIRDAAGQELVSACQRWVQQHGPVKPGESVWTTGGNLKCSHVLHVVPARRDGRERLAPVEMVKEMFVDILKTCTNSLKASMVSMPGIAAGAQVSRKVCAQAFFDAVLEITQLYQQDWLQLDTLVLVDQNKATVMECQQVFSDAILSGCFNEFVQWDGSSLSNGQASCFAECADNAYNEFASAEPWKRNASGAVPRLRPKGPNWFSAKRHQKHPATKSKRHDTHPHAPSTSAIGDQWDRWEPAERERSISPRPVNECPICLGEIRNEKRLRCGHSFCRICVNTALKTRKYCPLCKQSV